MKRRLTGLAVALALAGVLAPAVSSSSATPAAPAVAHDGGQCPFGSGPDI